jgi:predicted  nucleic acid-binding Zn-ribbon protein
MLASYERIRQLANDTQAAQMTGNIQNLGHRVEELRTQVGSGQQAAERDLQEVRQGCSNLENLLSARLLASQHGLEEVKQVVQNLANTIATTPELVRQGANEIMEGLRSYLETRITTVKEQVERVEATIAAVNGSLGTLWEGVTKLQQSRGTRFDQLEKDLGREKAKNKELSTKFNKLQARVAQDAFELTAHQKLAREHREKMEKRVQDVEANFDAFLAAIERAKEAADPMMDTQEKVLPPIPSKQPLGPMDPPPSCPSYHAVPPPAPRNPRAQSLFRTDPFASAVKQPKSLKPGKLPTYDGHGTDKFRTYWEKLEQHVALYSEYYEGRGSDEMIMIAGQTLTDDAASWYQDYSNQLRDGMLNSNFDHFRETIQSRFIKSSEAEDNLRKIMKLEYGNQIDDYLVQMKRLNRACKISGTAWRHHLEQGLNQEIRTMMSLVPEPASDNNFVELIRRTGRTHEDNQRQAKIFGQ